MKIFKLQLLQYYEALKSVINVSHNGKKSRRMCDLHIKYSKKMQKIKMNK